MAIKFSKTPSTANTVLSDLNEILVGFILNKQKWFSKEAEEQHDMRAGQVTKEQYEDAYGKAAVMCEEFIKWAKANKYSGTVKQVWWTARPGSMSEAVGYEVDQRKNPTDVLVKFTKGPANGFLGLSAKATKGSGDIGFSNPGIGTLDKYLKLNLNQINEKAAAAIIKKYKLSASASVRKGEIRAKKPLQAITQAEGAKVLSDTRDALFKKLKTMQQKDLLRFINEQLLKSEELNPPYIKVTGMGKKPPYTAKVDDPVNNPKLDALRKGPITVEKTGAAAVGFSANGKKIAKLRFKFESEPLASSVKGSGEPF